MKLSGSIILALSSLTISLPMLCGTLEAKPRTCRLIYPERPDTAPKTAYLFDGAKCTKVTLPSMNLSEVIELPPGDLTIAMIPQEVSDPKMLPANSPLLKIPDATVDFYIMITPDATSPDMPIKLNLVDYDAESFSAGATLWLNQTTHHIIAKLGEVDVSITPNGRTISKGAASSSGYYTAKFSYQQNGGGPFVPITEQMWWHDAACRHLGFIVSTGGKLPKIYTFRDFREPRPQPELSP